MFGLKEEDILFIIHFAKRHQEIEAVGIFGSRALGKQKETSDIDIILYGKKIDGMILNHAEEVLENKSPYPFYVDIKHYDTISDTVFKREVDQSVILIYEKSKNPESQ